MMRSTSLEGTTSGIPMTRTSSLDAGGVPMMRDTSFALTSFDDIDIPLGIGGSSLGGHSSNTIGLPLLVLHVK